MLLDNPYPQGGDQLMTLSVKNLQRERICCVEIFALYMHEGVVKSIELQAKLEVANWLNCMAK